MGDAWLLFSFEGRINRAKVWLAGLTILSFAACLGLLLFAAARLFGSTGPRSFGFDASDVFRLVDPAAVRTGIENIRKADTAATLLPVLFRVIVTPVAGWCFAAAAVKRLHDRNKSGWWLVPFIVIPGLFQQFEDRVGDSAAVSILGLVVAGLGIWGAIEMLFLRGTRKTNRFGPDPLPAVNAHRSA
jgi:uncharacterized membrane protein YhaH (DUF805 family)